MRLSLALSPNTIIASLKHTTARPTLPEEVTSATHIRNGLSVALGAAWKESMASRTVGPWYHSDSGPPSVLLDTFSADSPDAGTKRTYNQEVEQGQVGLKLGVGFVDGGPGSGLGRKGVGANANCSGV